MSTVNRHNGPRGTVTYRIAGQREEFDSTGTYPVKVKQITIWGNGTVDVTGRLTNRELNAMLTAIVADQRAAAQASS